MPNTFTIGDLEVLVVSDGDAKAPATVYFPGSSTEQWEPHKRWLDHEGNVVFPFTCFLIRSGDHRVLIDTGLGPTKLWTFKGGALLNELASAGVKPEEIDTVFLTHLHIDHCGTVALPENGAMEAVFPNATYRWTADEDKYWRNFKATIPGTDFNIAEMFSAIEGQFKVADDGATIAPGVTVIGTPGHTPGHAGIVLSSGTERAFILGDAISCPVQLEQPEWSGMGDVDPKLARQSQEAVVREAEATGDLLTACHFPGLTFGRVLRGEGRRYWEAIN
jgi:glyoxylase-like metal-dependent hydrolase (beta-lactamase superfamily II)